MKFGKEFASQMVHEWQPAYMDYNYLKSVLKDIIFFRQRNPPSPTTATPKGSLNRRMSLYRAFSGLTTLSRYNSVKVSPEDEVILVSAVGEESSERKYQTMFLRSSEEGGDSELVFFKRLDDEFNKVVKFYKDKMEEAIEEAEELNKQMDALIALRIKVDNPLVGLRDDKATNLHTHGASSFPASFSASVNGRKSGASRMDVIEEVEMSSEDSVEDGTESSNHRKVDEAKTNTESGLKPSHLDVLGHVKIKFSPDSPVSTLRRVLKSSKPDISFTKEELKKVEELIRQAFIVFYEKLRLLKNYCFLNQLAFSKILKKYDKITSRNASKPYLHMIDNSYLGSSDEVTRLIERVETTFIKHFSNGNRKNGINALRTVAKKERHRITFFVGLFTGCSIALVVAIIVLIRARHLLDNEGRGLYMESVFPLYSMFGLIILHMLMYAANLYFWSRFRVNYPFIFGFKQGTELSYRKVLLLATGLAVLTFSIVLSNLDMDMDPKTKSFRALTELVPLGLVIVVLLITFCPFNIFYRSSRFFLLQCTWHCICAPLYKVTLPDFFLADQLTSQVEAIRNLQFYICYYGWGDFKTRSSTCRQSDAFHLFYIIVAIVPYWARFLQCVRRLVEEKDHMHALNGLKYFSTIVAVVMRTSYDRNGGMTWKILAAVSSGIATIGGMYWDVVLDWGLLQRNSKNPWLRDKLLVPNKIVYFAAVVLNTILRLAWMQSVLDFRQTPFLQRRALTAIFASLEIIRRGIWNFFRLENEHLNNVGKYRAFKSVPLPFNYGDEYKTV